MCYSSISPLTPGLKEKLGGAMEPAVYSCAPPRPPRTGKKLCPRPPRMAAALLLAAVAASSQLPLLLLATGVAVVELLLLSRDLTSSRGDNDVVVFTVFREASEH